jgi:hypothetical protein
MSYTKTTDFAVQGVLTSKQIQRNIRGTALDTEFDALEAGVQSSVNVKEFGAVGDGVTDDTAAFTNAIATGNNVYIPEGVYQIDPSQSGTTTTGFSLASGQKILGSGSNTVLDIQIPTGRSSLFELTDVSWSEIGHFKILGNCSGPFDETYTATDGLSAVCRATSTVDWGVSNNEIHHIEATEFAGLLSTPYYQAGPTDPRFPQREWHIHNCKISYTTSHGVGGNFIHNSLIDNNEFRNMGVLCVDFSTEGAYNIIQNNFCLVAPGFAKFQEHTSFDPRNFHSHGKIINNTAYGLHGGASSNVHGIKVMGDHNEISGNVLFSNTGAYAGIQLDGDGIIINNDLHADSNTPSTGGIKILGGTYASLAPSVTVRGNRVDNWRHALRIEVGTAYKEITISDNALTGCEMGIRALFLADIMDRMTISNNRITCDHPNNTNNFGIQFGSTTGSVDKLIITDNNIWSHSNCVMLYASDSVIATGNIIETVAGGLILALTGVTNALVMNNYGKGGVWTTETTPLPTYGGLSGVVFANNYAY